MRNADNSQYLLCLRNSVCSDLQRNHEKELRVLVDRKLLLCAIAWTVWHLRSFRLDGIVETKSFLWRLFHRGVET